MNSFPFVSVILPVHNESAYIRRGLLSILAQDYPADHMEILIVDGMSTDDTRTIIESVLHSSLSVPHLRPSVIIIDNSARIVPTGMNLALYQAKGDIIARVDGHTVIAPDYVRQCVEALQRTQAENVGGKMNAVGNTAFGKAVALATSTPFGVGGARFHYSDQEEWVDTVYMGAWPRQVFEKIGTFDEELVRNQDDEFNYRLREQGGRILLSPAIRSEYTVRSTPRALWAQYYQYGYWKVRVLQKHPRQMRPRQFAPPAFVLLLLFSILFTTLSMTHSPPSILGLLSCIIPAIYLLANLLASLWTVSKRGWGPLLFLPLVYAILHISYGLGFLIGLVRFSTRWGDKHGKVSPMKKGIPENADLARLRVEYSLRDHSLEKTGQYSLFNVSQLFIVQQRQRAMLKCLRYNGFYPLSGQRILEMGCGSGGVLLETLSFGAAAEYLHGTDLLFERVQMAHHTLRNLPLTSSDGQNLPYATASFDLTMQFMVFSSILDDEVKTNLSRELLRVTRPGGMILWYDFWLNPTNPQTRGIRPAEIRRLFPSCQFQFERITLAPPLARRIAPISWGLSLLLERLMIFNTHYLVAIRHSFNKPSWDKK